MRRSYPRQNPFPYQGALSLAYELIPNSQLEEANTPTLPLAPIERLVSLTQQYLDRFKPDAKKRGQVVALRGEPGTGKTHAIFFARRAEYRLNCPPPIHVYASAGG